MSRTAIQQIVPGRFDAFGLGNLHPSTMAPADLLRPLEGQRAETLRLIDSLTNDDLDLVVEGDGRRVRQLLHHLASREHGIAFTVAAALEGEFVHLDEKARAQLTGVEYEPAPDWDVARIRGELEESREALRRTFERMTDEDLDRPIRWPEWPARTIRGSIPYILEHEDSHLDDLRRTLSGRERVENGLTD
jgi:DinB superfamily